MEKLIHLSVIMPIYNKAAEMTSLHSSTTQLLRAQDASYELIYVDNGSTDTTLALLQDLASQDQHVQVVQLQQNVSWSAAVARGISLSRGNLLVYLDDEIRQDALAVGAQAA